jgi:DNA primase
LTNYLWELVKSSYPGDAAALPKLSGGAGRWWMAKCPLHDDHEPSFSIDSKNGTWRCFSSGCCGHAGGDVINLYALANKITIGEAIRQLAKVLP